jgi:hypothetical protein
MANNWTTMLDNGSFIYGAEQNDAYNSNTNYQLYNNPIIGGVNFRKGVRDGCFVRDVELVTNGFSLPENIGWTNIFKIC